MTVSDAHMPSDRPVRARNVTAVLGPTNTGKTHLAIERMLGHETGVIGLPLRLLAREVYDRIVAKIGPREVALVTGEEKIKPENPRYWVSTVEAMPLEVKADFVAIDEIQLAADPERGHIFTQRLLSMRGMQETLLLGAGTMRQVIQDLLPGANFVNRPRLSKLTYSGQKKISRLPPRTAIVAFSASDVYEIAELIRRQRGGAAVVLGALSPRTRNAQVALYQSGDVDFMVATDAVGMGLNLDVDHVAFAAIRKFDGARHRMLTVAEIGQIGGRAGRHTNDGTFGVTGDVEPLESELVEALENHQFEPVKQLQWRNNALDFSSLDALRDSLNVAPRLPQLVRARIADDHAALDTLARRPDIADKADSPEAVRQLWEVCQLPDYRKIASDHHAELVATVYDYLRGPDGRIPDTWLEEQVARDDRTDGDIDTLSTRLAHIRTWTFLSHRADWLHDAEAWQDRTRAVEDRLSDALHEQLTQRFVDKRTSVLMKRLRDSEDLYAEIASDGAVHVEKHYVGRLHGFRFEADTSAQDLQGKAARGAAQQALVSELAMRARRVAAAKADAFVLKRNGDVVWKDEIIARISKGDDILKPTVQILTDDTMPGPDVEKVQARLDLWLTEYVDERLKPLLQLTRAEEISGLARGMAFRLKEALGLLKREPVADEVKSLDQTARAQLRKYGVRFGAFNIYLPLLLKPAASEAIQILWGLQQDGGLEALPEPPRAGLTSFAAQPGVPEEFYRACGYHLCGPRVVRLDILERLSDMIRPMVAWRKPKETTAAFEATTDAKAGAQEAEKDSKTPSEPVPADMVATEPTAPTGNAEATSVDDAVEAATPEQASVAASEGEVASVSDEPSVQQTGAEDAAAVPVPVQAAASAEPAEGTSEQAEAAAPAEDAPAKESKPANKAQSQARSKNARSKASRPKGATGDGGFLVQPDMLSILGCSADELGAVLSTLGFRVDRKTREVAEGLGVELPAKRAPAKTAPNKTSGDADSTAAPEQDPTVASADKPAAGADGSEAAGANSESMAAPSAEPSEVTQTSASGADDIAREEPDIIEIWRPRRRFADGPRHGRRDGQNAKPGTARQGRGAGRGRDQRGPSGDGEKRQEGQSEGRQARRQGERHKGGGAPSGRNRQRGDKRDHAGKGKPAAVAPRPASRREADPDSPFAALSQLKKQLEGKGNGNGKNKEDRRT